MNLGEQIERSVTHELMKHGKPWRVVRDRHNTYKWRKQIKHRIERRRAKHDPECMPCYKKYCGWEW